jgi:Flp pilus assembly protein TadD
MFSHSPLPRPDAGQPLVPAHERVPLAWLGLVVLGVVATFSPILLNGWILGDDEINVVDNEFFYPVTWQSLLRLCSRSYFDMYIPISYALFAAESTLSRWLAGDGPTGPIRPLVFHATSLSLHLVTVLLVGRMFRRMGASWRAACLGALVFAVHPLQVESVAWISEQRGLAAAALSMAALNLFLDALPNERSGHDHRHGLFSVRYGLASILFVAALLAKPTATITPLVAAAVSIAGSLAGYRTLAGLLVPWCVLAGIGMIVTRTVQPANDIFQTPPLLRPIIAGDALAFYAEKFVMPTDLCFYYGRTPQRVLADPGAPWRASLAAAGLALVFGLRPLKAFRLPLAITMAGLLPVMGLVPFVYQHISTVADRYVYFAMLGPALAVAHVLDSRPTDRQWPWLAAAGFVLLAWATMSFRQATVWRDTGSVARHACVVAPDTEAGWALLSGHSLFIGAPQQAAAAAEQALRIVPTHSTALVNLAAAAARLDDMPAAVAALKRLQSVGFPPDETAEIFFKRGCQLLSAERQEEAVADFLLALEAQPSHRRAAINLGIALTRVGRYEKAVEVLERALQQDPADLPALVSLGNALLRAGRLREAIDSYDRALAVAPDDTDALLNRAQAQLASGNTAAAEADIARARRLMDSAGQAGPRPR